MARHMKFWFIVLFICFTFGAVALYIIGPTILPTISPTQHKVLLGIVVLVGSVFLSFAVDVIFVFPLKKFQKKIEATWKDRQQIPTTFGSSNEGVETAGTIDDAAAKLSEKKGHIIIKEKDVPLPAELRDTVQVFTSIIDGIQQKVKALGEMQKLDATKYEFIAIANHQLRTPITEIGWAVESLQSLMTSFCAVPSSASISASASTSAPATESASPQPASLSQAQELIQKIQNGVSRITDITDQFLAVAELSVANEVERKISVDVGTILTTVIAKLSAQAKAKDMEFRIEKAASLVSVVMGDVRIITFIFETLLTNALVYGNAGTEVVVGMANSEAALKVSVDDIGIGLSNEERTLMFEKFFRGSEARRARPDGSGLALYLTKRAIDSYGGSLSVETKPDNRISFTVTLPLGTKGELQQFAGNY